MSNDTMHNEEHKRLSPIINAALSILLLPSEWFVDRGIFEAMRQEIGGGKKDQGKELSAITRNSRERKTLLLY